MKRNRRPDERQTPPAEGGPPRLITTSAAAKLLSVSTRTVLRMGEDGTIPPPVRLGPHFLRWRLSDILALIDRQK